MLIARRHFDAGDFEKSEPVYRRALLFFDEGEELRQCLQLLAEMYAAWQNYSSSLEMMVRLLSLNEREFGKTDARTISVMREMGSIYLKTGQAQKAEKIQQRANEREQGRTSKNLAIDVRNTEALASPAPGVEQHQKPQAQNESTLGMRERLEKSAEQVRPIVSGVMIDFSHKGVKLLAQIIGSIVVLCVVIFVAQILPRNPSPLKVYRSIPHGYRTADNKMEFKLLDDTQCAYNTSGVQIIPGAQPVPGDQSNSTLTSTAAPEAAASDNPEILTLPYYQFLSDWRDFLAVSLSSLGEKQYWIFRQDDAVLDQDGRTLYAWRSPESEVIDETIIISNAVNTFYDQVHRYPQDLSETAVPSFKNPLTGKLDPANYQRVELGDKKWTTARSLNELSTFYTSLRNGASWPNEPALKPCSVNCVHVVMRSEAGEFYNFLIRGSDRYGKCLPSSVPGIPYLLALQNAKELKLEHPNLPFAGSLPFRPRRIWLMQPNLGSSTLLLLHHGLTYLCATVSLYFLVTWSQKYLHTGFQKKHIKYLIYCALWGMGCLVYELSWLCS